MKTKLIDLFTFPVNKNWDRSNGKITKIFTLLTGYYIMQEESRKDLKQKKSTGPLKKTKRDR
jgi:hypothetical protein